MTESLWNKYDFSRKSPEVPVNRSPKVVRIERALALNAPWDSTAIGWKIYELVRLVYFASLRLLLLLSKEIYMSGSKPYSGRSSSIKPSCSKTELKRWKSVETKKKQVAQTSQWSPPIASRPTRSRTEEKRLKVRDMKVQVKNKKIFLRSTALYVFHITEPFITI